MRILTRSCLDDIDELLALDSAPVQKTATAEKPKATASQPSIPAKGESAQKRWAAARSELDC